MPVIPSANGSYDQLEASKSLKIIRAPNRTRIACQATAALCGHVPGGAIAVFGATIWYAPKCSISARIAAASGTEATAARAFAASPVRTFRAAATR